MERAFHALAEPNRRRILEILVDSNELSSGEIASHFQQTAAAVSQHLGVLEKARLVSIRRDGTRRLYRLREDGFRELRGYLERFWTERLTQLKAAVETEVDGAPRAPGKDKGSQSRGPRSERRARRD